MFHDIYFTRFTRLDNNLVESWDLYIAPLDWHFKSGDSMHAVFDFNPVYERLFETFEISPGVFLPPGEYRFTRFRSNAMTAARRKLSGSFSIGTGNYWSGEAEQVTASVTFKLPPWFTMSASTNQTFARLPEGDFIARIYTSNINYTASPRLSFSNLVQYDNRSRNLGWQSRIRWTLRPGNDFFFAFNQGWMQEEEENRNLRFRGAGQQGVGEIPVLAPVLMRIRCRSLVLTAAIACGTAPEPARETRRAASQPRAWVPGTDGQHDARIRQRVGIVPHHLESAEPGQRAAGRFSADASQRHQRPAHEGDRRPQRRRRRQRGVRRRSAHVRISRRIEWHRLDDFGGQEDLRCAPARAQSCREVSR